MYRLDSQAVEYPVEQGVHCSFFIICQALAREVLEQCGLDGVFQPEHARDLAVFVEPVPEADLGLLKGGYQRTKHCIEVIVELRQVRDDFGLAEVVRALLLNLKHMGRADAQPVCGAQLHTFLGQKMPEKLVHQPALT
ncbi:hypothetical protein D3C76_777090 [compost metagenome]